ncbi:MAG: hypothetical protein AAF985_01560 [Bacteroidota bacterium]
MKKIIWIYLFSGALTFGLHAQTFYLNGEKATNLPSQLKGQVQQIESWTHDLFAYMEFDYHHASRYENNRLVEGLSYFTDKQSINRHYYRSDGRLSKIEYLEYDSLKQSSRLTALRQYSYTPKKTKIHYQDAEGATQHRSELTYDQHQRLVTYHKHNPKGQLVEEVAYTYQFEQTGDQLLNFAEVTYQDGKVWRSKIKTFQYESFLLDSQLCTKVNILKAITVGDQTTEEHSKRYFSKAGREVRGVYNILGSERPYVNQYEYDERGNWIRYAQYETLTGKLSSFVQRAITYTDGLTTGGKTLSSKQIKSLERPPKEEEYYYVRIPETNRFKIFTGKGTNISKRIRWLGTAQSNSAFLYDSTQQAVIELIDYVEVESSSYQHEARLLSKDQPNFLLKNGQQNFWIFLNGKVVQREDYDFKSLLGHDIFYHLPSKVSYSTLWSSLAVNEVLTLQQLPESPDDFYWLLAKSEGKEYVWFFQYGKLVESKAATSHWSGDDLLVKHQQKYYRCPQASKGLGKGFQVVTNISATTFQQAVQAQNNKPVAQQEVKADQTNFGCYQDVSCLNRYAIAVFQKMKSNGQSDAIAYQSMSQVVEQVYRYKKELSFDMIMKIDEKYMMNINQNLSPEVRKYIKKRSQDAVSQYTQKHGKPKIKTVPYRPKN